MATAKKNADDPNAGVGVKDENADPEAGVAEVQEKFDEATDKGYFGSVADPIENKEYSLQSGPESPTIAEQKEAYSKKIADEERHPTGNAL